MSLLQLDDDILIGIIELLDDYSKVNFLILLSDNFTLINYFKAKPIILNYSMVDIHQYGNFNYKNIITLIEQGYRFQLNFQLDFNYHYEVAQSLANKHFSKYKLEFNKVYTDTANHRLSLAKPDWPLIYEVYIEKN